jgi:SAM-dependent methyltransferase
MRIAYLVRYEGIVTAVKVCLSELLGLLGIRRQADFRYGAYYDALTGVDTAGAIPPRDLDISPNHRAHSNEYAPTPAPIVRHILGSIEIPFERFDFVDFGSGKGRVLLVAAERPFARVIGVEVSPSLDAIARDNIAAYRRRVPASPEIESIRMDVADYCLPTDPCVLFFFNPFDESVFQRVLDNVETSLKEHPRPAILVYYHATETDRQMVERLGMFRLRRRGTYDNHSWWIYSTPQPPPSLAAA